MAINCFTKLGTHDISLLNISNDAETGILIETKRCDGDSKLGGKDIDEKIVNWIVDGIKEDCGVDVKSDAMAMQRIKEAAEKAKIELSATTSTEINLPYITADATGPKHYVQTLNRAKFEVMISDIVAKTMAPVKRVLEAENMSVSEVDEVLLVGGSTRIPAIQKAVKEYFGKEPSKGVNPDEAVAIGASIQAAILSGDEDIKDKDILLLDVIPMNIGIETAGGIMHTMIPSGTTFPYKTTSTFTTYSDNQTCVTCAIAQGPYNEFAKNHLIGVFNLDGIAPARRGVPQIEITIDIDANSVITVTAMDKATNKEQHITITGDSGLSKEEIERMKAEAEANAEEDKKFMENANKLNEAEGIAYNIKKSTDEDNIKDALTEDEKKDIVEKCDAVLEAVKTKDVDKVSELRKELEEKWEPIVAKVYANKPNEGATAETVNEDAANATPNDGEQPTTEDVPFEEVK